jgi:tetratricopeptide (TPR) repeat protein
MSRRLIARFATLLIATVGSSSLGQTPAPPNPKPTAPGLIKLTGEDEKRAKELDEQIDMAMKTDRWDEAIARALELVALRTRVQGPTHFEVVNAEWRLKTMRRMGMMPHDDRVAYQSGVTASEQARILSDQGKYSEAQPLYEKSLKINRRLLTDLNPETVLSLSNLAGNLNDQGKYAQALPLYEKALELSTRLLTEMHLGTAAAYNNLAYNLYAQGKYTRAQPLYEKALEISRGLLGDLHLDIAATYNNLGANLGAQGKYGQAQPLYEKAIGIYRRLLTERHPLTASSYSNLASNLTAQGKYAQALPLYEKALEIDRCVLTDLHPDTATGYNGVAFNLYAQGQYALAQPLFEKALEIRRLLLTDDHPLTANSYNSVASNLSNQGKYAQAQPLYEKALQIRCRLLTDLHPDTAGSYNNVAHNLRLQGKFDQAQPLYEKAVEITRGLLTDDHPLTALAYNNLAGNLESQGKFVPAQAFFEKALEIRRRVLTESHPDTAASYNNVAGNLESQGKYVAAQALYEKAVEINRRVLMDDHPGTANSYTNLAHNLNAQGKYLEARDQWRRAVQRLDSARLRVAFTGMERAAAKNSARPSLAAVLARLAQPGEAWQALEEDLGRGLLDELAARQDRRLAPEERARLREVTSTLERLDKLVESTPKGLDQVERANPFEALKRQRELASIALGEFQTKLVKDHGPLAGQVASLSEIQAALPADAALVAWVDLVPRGPSADDPDGEHWGVVVRSRGIPAWVPIVGTGPGGLWTKDDTGLAARVRTELRRRPGASPADLRPPVERLRTQRLEPLAKAMSTMADGLPPARRLIVLPSGAMAGIPVEALLASGDTRSVSYAPSATVFKYLREQPRPGRHAGLLALGDPVYERPDTSSEPKPLPAHGLLVNVVMPGSNAATHGLKAGDVLLAYNGTALNKKDDLKVVAEGDKLVGVEIWRDGQMARRELAPSKLGVVLDPRAAREAIAEQRKLQQVLAAARSGGDDFSPLPGTRREIEAIARLFRSDDRPTRALLGTDASEPELDRIASAGELRRFGFIHLATHGVIDESIPQRSAVILTQSNLPDPLDQVLNHKPVFDGRLSVREIQRSWDLKADLVTLSACETALGHESGGEGFVGFTQALLMSGARSVCLSLWKVDDKATSLLMTRFYQNLLGKRSGLSTAMPKADALTEAKQWLRNLTADQVDGELAALERGEVRPLTREKGAHARKEALASKSSTIRSYEHPYFWAAFVLVGDPD